MKKIVEVEYVGIEDVQEIMDDAYACMREGHYVGVSLSNCGDEPLVSVNIIVGGYYEGKETDYSFIFMMSDSERSVKEMNECKSVLKNLLAGGDE